MVDTDKTWEAEAADALRRLALDENVKAYVLQHPELYRSLYRAALRFIAGETLEECVSAARSINDQGHAVTIDFMGESTRREEEACAAAAEFLRVIDTIEANALDASISFDLSHLGLVVDPELCFENASSIVKAAADADLEIMISAEGVDRTDAVLALHGRLCERYENVGITIQAFLHRAPNDLELVSKRPCKVRVVKGAFEAPETLAMSRGEALDQAYMQLVNIRLDRQAPCSIATHDPAILKHFLDGFETRNADGDLIEFEMLKGIAGEQLDAIRDMGYQTRVYLPYGKEWHLYLCNRLAEYPPNVFQAIHDATRADSDEAVSQNK